MPVIEQIKATGVTSLRAVSRALNARGIATARGGVWTPVQSDRRAAPAVLIKSGFSTRSRFARTRSVPMFGAT
jgi:hypothetical protein